MAGIDALLIPVLLAAALAGAVAMMLLLVGLVRLEAARQTSTCGRQLHSAAWANQAWRPADDCLEWCLIGATGDDAEVHPSRRKPNLSGRRGDHGRMKTSDLGNNAK